MITVSTKKIIQQKNPENTVHKNRHSFQTFK